jgi:hypothetical protein
VYGVPLNHKSETEDFSFFVFQSVSWANMVNTNTPPLAANMCFSLFGIKLDLEKKVEAQLLLLVAYS